MTKTLISGSALALLMVPMAYGQVPVDQVSKSLKAAQEYGIVQYQEVEFDDDGSAEVEGWLDAEWYAEVEISANGEVIQEERKRRDGGPMGMTLSDVQSLIDSAKSQGITLIEEISVDESGQIELEGENAQGRDIELSNAKSAMDAAKSAF
jgi:hypothetical protein